MLRTCSQLWANTKTAEVTERPVHRLTSENEVRGNVPVTFCDQTFSQTLLCRERRVSGHKKRARGKVSHSMSLGQLYDLGSQRLPIEASTRIELVFISKSPPLLDRVCNVSAKDWQLLS